MFVEAFVVVVVTVTVCTKKYELFVGKCISTDFYEHIFSRSFINFHFVEQTDPRTKTKWLCWLYRHIWDSNCANLKLVHRFEAAMSMVCICYELMMTGLLIRNRFCIVCKMPIGLVGELKITNKRRSKTTNCKIFEGKNGHSFLWMRYYLWYGVIERKSFKNFSLILPAI